MKKLLSIIGFAIATLSMQSCATQLRIGANIGVQPYWGPAGYDHVEYYYLPDIEAYYYVTTHQFVFREGGNWIFAASLPPRWANYDLVHGYKVVINEPKPYLHFDEHRVKYAQYKNWNQHQEIIEERHSEPKYQYHWHDDGQHRDDRRDHH